MSTQVLRILGHNSYPRSASALRVVRATRPCGFPSLKHTEPNQVHAHQRSNFSSSSTVLLPRRGIDPFPFDRKPYVSEMKDKIYELLNGKEDPVWRSLLEAEAARLYPTVMEAFGIPETRRGYKMLMNRVLSSVFPHNDRTICAFRTTFIDHSGDNDDLRLTEVRDESVGEAVRSSRIQRESIASLDSGDGKLCIRAVDSPHVVGALLAACLHFMPTTRIGTRTAPPVLAEIALGNKTVTVYLQPNCAPVFQYDSMLKSDFKIPDSHGSGGPASNGTGGSPPVPAFPILPQDVRPGPAERRF
ncbi:hypothetical protein CF319_g2745 [Tilletia indica]|nr:hypothetical protein CF319_g2745 [Tilletia indica]